MAHYIISITEYDDKSEQVNKVAIELDTVYTIVRDISEWVKEEVDSNAQFIDITPERAWKQNVQVQFADGTNQTFYDVQFGVPISDFREYDVESVTLFLATE